MCPTGSQQLPGEVSTARAAPRQDQGSHVANPLRCGLPAQPQVHQQRVLKGKFLSVDKFFFFLNDEQIEGNAE